VELWQFHLPCRRNAGVAGLIEPDIAAPRSKAVALAKKDLGFVVLDDEAFVRAPKTSIDYAVMERAHRAAVLGADVGWSDVG
jgi:mannose-1-phosphate guanylyltransferase / mannose-6-phosphate isomerase